MRKRTIVKLLLLLILVLNPGYANRTTLRKEIINVDLNYDPQIREITNNLNDAKTELNKASVIISDPKRLKQIKKKLKSNK